MASSPAQDKAKDKAAKVKAGKARSLLNLKPNPGGEIRNPTGKNQYTSTYRLDFEKSIDVMLRGPLSEALLAHIPKEIRVIVAEHPEMTPGQAIALAQVIRSLEGDEKAVATTLERLWPRVERHELSGADGGPLEVEGRDPWSLLAGRVDRVKERQGDTAKDREPAGRRKEETLQ